MADERRIVIELKTRVDSPKTKEKEDTKEEEKLDLSFLLHPVKNVEKAIIKNAIVLNAYNNAKSIIKNEARYEITKYLSLTENYTAQQAVDNALTAIGKVGEFGSAVISGAIIGTSAGPGGAIAGAAVAAVGNVVSNVVQVYQRFDQQDRNLATVNVQSQFQLVRMGLLDGGRNSLN